MTTLHRTNINLVAEDVAYFQQKYGYGWTEKVREIVHAWVLDREIANLRTVDAKERMIWDIEHE